jgi:hypothetical protein
MDYAEKQLESLKTLSQSCCITILTTIVVSIYVLQREIRAVAGVLDSMGRQQQMEYKGLKFEYATMTFVWPFAIGALGLLLRTLSTKRQTVLQELVQSSPATSVIAADPWCFFADKKLNMLRVLTWASFSVPVIALLKMIPIIYLVSESTFTGSLLEAAGILFGLCSMPAFWFGLRSFLLQPQEDIQPPTPTPSAGSLVEQALDM